MRETLAKHLKLGVWEKVLIATRSKVEGAVTMQLCRQSAGKTSVFNFLLWKNG